jgi:hypothetical protein
MLAEGKHADREGNYNHHGVDGVWMQTPSDWTQHLGPSKDT